MAEEELRNESGAQPEQEKAVSNYVCVEDVRHPTMKGVSRDYLERLQDELDVDQQLGLKNQMEIDTAQVLKEDINDLTKSNEYYQVTPELIEKIFRVPQMNLKCFWLNVWEAISKTVMAFKYALCFWIPSFVAAWFSVASFVHFAANQKEFLSFQGVMLALASVIMLICGFTIGMKGKETVIKKVTKQGSYRDAPELVEEQRAFVFRFNYKFLWVKVKQENIKETGIKLPYHAKLKVLEARDKKIFEDFIIMYPEMHIITHEVEKITVIENRPPDPVILGVTRDKRFYMVAWWDIEKDIDRVEQNIELFKKFKVPA